MNVRGWLTAAAWVVGLLIVGGAFFLLQRDEVGDGNPRTENGMTITEYEANHHTDDDVDYAQTPPMGGLHDDQPLKCGVYDEPVRDENAVHTIEHGAVWITYLPSLPAADVAKLEALLPEKHVLSPRDDLPSPVVATAWNRQLPVEGVDDPRLKAFVDEYADGHTAPEDVSCEDGVEEFD